MNRNLLLLTVLLASAGVNLFAQRGGGGHGVAGPASSAARSGFSQGRGTRSFNRGDYRGYNRYSDLGWLYSDYYGDYWGLGWGWDYQEFPFHSPDYDNALRPELPLVVPAQEQAPPPPPAEPVIHEYSWPDSGRAGASAFAIVSKDGTVHRALAVWVQDDNLCFTTPNGGGRRLSLNDIDGPATTRMNAELKLKLPMLFGDSDLDAPVNAPAADHSKS